MAAIGVPRAGRLRLAQPLLPLVRSFLLLGETVSAAAPVAALAVLVCIAAAQRAGLARVHDEPDPLHRAKSPSGHRLVDMDRHL